MIETTKLEKAQGLRRKLFLAVPVLDIQPDVTRWLADAVVRRPCSERLPVLRASLKSAHGHGAGARTGALSRPMIVENFRTAAGTHQQTAA